MSNTERKQRILIISAHPDDETLGCGGTILRFHAEKHAVLWLNLTCAREEDGFERKDIQARESELCLVKKAYSFDESYSLGLPATLLDTIPLRNIVAQIADIVRRSKATEIFVTHSGDAHTDHQVCFKAAWSASKSFRAPSVRSFYTYETLSETNFSPPFFANAFTPNAYIDISPYFQKKKEIMNLYKTEIKAHPFPRSEAALESLAVLRGSEAGVKYAEAFMCLWRVT